MLLPYSLDKIPERLGMLYSKLFGWQPVGKRVLLRVTEGEPDFYGKTLLGTVINFENITKGVRLLEGRRPSVIIQLDSPWHYKSRTTSTAEFVLALPRFDSHSVYRLVITSAYVHVFPLDSPQWPRDLRWEDMIAICDLRWIR